MNTILLATDGSPSAVLATTEAIDLATATGWPLRIVTVWRTPVVAGYGYAPVAVVPELTELEKTHAAEVVEAAADQARARGAHVTVQIREGDAADEICGAAEEAAAQLIVVGAHGWGAVKRAVFGSVSTRVLHEAPCGVLVVREQHR